METVTFPRPDVRKWLAGVVKVRVDVTYEGEHEDMARKFNVRAVPTLVLILPTGETLYNDPGAPAPEQFMVVLGYEPYDRMVKKYNGRDYVGCAPDVFLVRKWFSGSEIGQQADEIQEHMADHEGYQKAYAEAEKAYTEALAKAQAELKELEAKEEVERAAAEEQAQREKARKIKAEADALFRKGKRVAAWPIYKRVIQECPKTPEADEVRQLLKKHRVKWEEPG